MNAFEYASPASVELALKALGGSDSAVLSGGTDLLNRIKDEVLSPGRLVAVNQIKAISGITENGGGLVIGAATRLADIVKNPTIKSSYPALLQAALEVGTPQIRNMATLGGNLLQRPRCWYFRAGQGLLAVKDGKSLVREGDNRYHAIFLTTGNALFAHPSSLSAPLIALGAKATIAGPRGERTVGVEELYQVPKSEKDSELTVAAGELLTKITIPGAFGKNATYEVRQKQAHDWPLVLASVNLEMEGETVIGPRIVLSAVAPVPYRCEAAERAIKGKPLSLENASAAAEAAVEGAKPLSMNSYKVALTKVAVKRALLAAVGNRYWEEA